MNSWTILLSMLLGTVGFGYIIYGKKQKHSMALISGILLCVFPYFVSNLWLMLLLAAVVMALPRFVDF